MSAHRSRRARTSQSNSRSPRKLRCEQLEARTVLAALSPLGNLPVLAISPVGSLSVDAKTATAPTVVNAAGASLSSSGATASLSVLGADAQGESTLTYTWVATSVPGGGAAKFSVNGTNAAKNDTVTFTEAGTYGFTVTIVDGAKLSITSSVKVTVAQTLTSVSLYSGGKTLVSSSTQLKVTATNQSFSALGVDQFGYPMAPQPSFAWAVTSSPNGAKPSLTNSNGLETVIFNEAGAYGVSVSAGNTTATRISALANILVVAEPTSFTVSQVGGSATVLATSAQFNVSQFFDQFQNPITENTTLTWSASVPAGAAAPHFTTSGSTTTASFALAGKYTLVVTQTDAAKNSVAESIIVNVGQTPAGTITGSTLTVTGVSQVLPNATFVDQFGKPITSATTYAWTAATLPAGASAPIFGTAANGTTATFSLAGTYVLKAQPSNGTASFSVTVNVKQTFTSILVTSGTPSLQTGATQQFTAQALDQFQNAMATQPSFTWSVNGGTVSSNGLFTAPSTAGTYSVTAKSGSISGSDNVTVTAPSPSPSPSPTPGGLQDPVLASLVQKLDADGSLDRADMIQILQTVAANIGTNGLSAMDFSDLKTIVADATQYDMPNYVEVLASDVVNGNAANAQYQGAALNDLAVRSSAAQLTKLIDKWFYGTDLPALTSSSLTYETASGSLFPNIPSNKDEYQGELGDCYFISSLGTIADSNPAAIENMFINNGDGTYTVRFYGGTYGGFYNSNGTFSLGFASGVGTASYVTVNLSLPTYYGTLIYADCGFSASNPANSLWIPLAEKAYAQWNETGLEGRNGTNTYAGIEGGWMAYVDAQVLGHNATDYSLTTSTEQAMVSGLNANDAVTIATDESSNSADTLPGGLYGSHAYAVLSYNASSGLFTLYNPWGCDQPNTLSWPQLESTCDGFDVATTSGSVPISSSNVQTSVAAAVSRISAAVSAVSTSPAATTNPAADYALWATTAANQNNSTNQPVAAAVDAVMAEGIFVN